MIEAGQPDVEAAKAYLLGADVARYPGAATIAQSFAAQLEQPKNGWAWPRFSRHPPSDDPLFQAFKRGLGLP